MERADARAQTRAELQERRELVVRLYRDGVPVMQIVKRSGLSWSAVNAAIRLFTSGGSAALVPAVRGRKQGSGRKLTMDQEAEVRQLIRLRRPWFYGLGDALWSRESVRSVVQQKLGISLSERGLGNYLRRWGLALSEPKTPPLKRCSPDVRHWIDKHQSEIDDQVKSSNTETYWVNQTTALDPELWGETKDGQVAAAISQAVADGGVMRKQRKTSMVSVVNNQGRLLWMIIGTPFNENQQINLLKALARDTRRKLILLIKRELNTFEGRNLVHRIESENVAIKIYPTKSLMD